MSDKNIDNNEIEYVPGSSIKETLEHKRQVSHYMNLVIKELIDRAEKHDNTKMEADEVEYFDEFTTKLKDSKYGSPEYMEFLENLKPALDHHYGRYRHHPEHFKNGMKDMNLIDLTELLIDWWASTLRHSNGDINKSIEINSERFKYGEEIKNLFHNTIEYLNNK